MNILRLCSILIDIRILKLNSIVDSIYPQYEKPDIH